MFFQIDLFSCNCRTLFIDKTIEASGLWGMTSLGNSNGGMHPWTFPNPSNSINISAINITVNANTDNPQELARQVAENTTVALQDKMQYIGYSRNFGYA